MTEKRPPRIAKWILQLFSFNEQSNSIVHNIEEEYYSIIEEKHKFIADMWFIKQVVKSTPRFTKTSIYWGVIMLLSYFKTALRTIVKQKEYSIINIFGLATGLASAILILFWVASELNHDGFHENKDDIYRVRVTRTAEGNTFTESDTPYLIANELKNKVPDVKHSSIYLRLPKFVLKCGEKSFYEDGIRTAGADFFLMFSFNFIEGSPEAALKNPGSIVITKSMAIKYFGNLSAVGKVMQLEGASFTVTGIIEDVPESSHLKFDFMIDSFIVEANYREMLSWYNFSARNYVQLNEGTNTTSAENKINSAILRNYNPEDIARFNVEFILQPLSQIYLTPAIMKYIYIFSLLGLLILFIACINYINLSTAISSKRMKEVGIRKVVGSGRGQLIKQFLTETFVTTTFATSLSIIITILVLPAFNKLTGQQIIIDFFSYEFFLTLSAIIIVTSILAGSYPAFYLSSFKPVKIIKGGTSTGSKPHRSRKFLVVSQYAISVGLIICTIVVSEQVGFMKSKDLGFDKDTIIYLPLSGELKDKFDVVKTELSANPNIAGVTASFYLPTARGRSRSGINWEGKDPDLRIMAETPKIEYEFFNILGMELVAGRNFSREFVTDIDDAFVINEEMARQMNSPSPVGKEISIGSMKGKVVGVIKDANFLPLRYNIEPQVFTLLNDMRETIRGTILIKLNSTSGEEITRTIAFINNIWDEHNSGEPFEYHFWNESLEQQYNSEQTIGTLFNYFSILAILISCLGLFGLVSLVVDQRKKEIGIRKTIGASAPSITFLLSKEFIKLILLANLIAWPITYYIMNLWLQDFAYKIDLSIWIFVISGSIALLIALLTISRHSIKASLINPVETLKYE